jgi:hypothetical protein
MADLPEQLQSINQSAADIQRWVLQMALTQRVSIDRRMDVIRAAERILALTKAL